jgi:outer membrane protein TolC
MMKRHRHEESTIPGMRFLCIACLLCCMAVFRPHAASASDPFGTNLTLRAVLDCGAENNPLLQAAWSRWQAAGESITVENGFPDPTFTYGYYFESVETKVGPQNQQFRLTQTFPGFGKRAARRAVASTLAASYEQHYRQEKLDLDRSIAEAFADLYVLKRSIDITRDSIQLVRDFEQVARTRYKAGSPMAPILQAQVELGRLEDRLASLNDLRQPYTARLNAALNRATGEPLPWPGKLPYMRMDINIDELQDALDRTSPELSALTLRVEKEAHLVDLARRERLPDFTVGMQYIDTGNSDTPVTDSGKDPIIGTIGINLPLWPGKNNARIAAAEHERTAATLLLDNREQILKADIQQTLFALRDADRKIDLYRDSLIPKARQSMDVNRKGYEAGNIEFINLIDAERVLLEFELAHEQALADHLIQRAELTRITGIDFLEGERNETH